jgi:catalase
MSPPSLNSTGNRSWDCNPSFGTKPSRSTALIPTSIGGIFGRIKSGNFPEWELQLQLFDQEFADSFDFDVLDPTKIIPEEVLPPIAVGRLVLDRMPDNFFAETEQVAFMTQNVPPGIDFSNDPLLQGRHFSYLDTQLKRLGSPNFTHIPINAPKCPFCSLPAGRPYGQAKSGGARQLSAEFVRRRTERVTSARFHTFHQALENVRFSFENDRRSPVRRS